jgi:hypothetical protein
MHQDPECQSDDPGTAESQATQSNDQCKIAHDRQATIRPLPSIQPISPCKDTVQVAPQRHIVQRHVRLRCSHSVGMCHLASHAPNLLASPAGTIPGKDFLHCIPTLQPNWKDLLAFCKLRHQRRNSPTCDDNTTSVLNGSSVRIYLVLDCKPYPFVFVRV